MATIVKTAVTINQPVKEVWQYFMNPDNLKNWLTGFVSITVESGLQGAPGSKNKLVLKERGKEIRVMETVLQVTPCEQFRSKMETTSLNSENEFRFISFGHYTEIIQTTQLYPNNLFMKIMMPFLKGTVKKTMTGDLINLKKKLEENK